MLVPDQSVFVDWQKVKVQEDSAQVRWRIQEQSLGKQLTYSKLTASPQCFVSSSTHPKQTNWAASCSSSGPAICQTAAQSTESCCCYMQFSLSGSHLHAARADVGQAFTEHQEDLASAAGASWQ